MHQHSNMGMGTKIVLLSSIAFYDHLVQDRDNWTTLAKTEIEAKTSNIWFRDRGQLRDLHSASKFYPQKLQKLFCANTRLFIVRAAPADELTLCQTFRYNLF